MGLRMRNTTAEARMTPRRKPWILRGSSTACAAASGAVLRVLHRIVAVVLLAVSSVGIAGPNLVAGGDLEAGTVPAGFVVTGGATTLRSATRIATWSRTAFA